MGWTLNLGCVKDPLFGTPWCLDFTNNSWIPLSIILFGLGIYILGKQQDWW